MFTRCPECKTVFRLSAEQVSAAGGRVRCGECDADFSSLEHIVALPTWVYEMEDGQSADSTSPVQHASHVIASLRNKGEQHASDMATRTPVAPPAKQGNNGLQVAEQQEQNDAPDNGESTATPPARPMQLQLDTRDIQRDESTPGVPLQIITKERNRRRHRNTAWGVGIVLLLALLPLHHLYYERLDYAQDPTWRPWIARLCAITGCEPEPLRIPDMIRLGTHTVQSHPRYQNSLLITATLKNEGEYAQPYPKVEFTMTDVQQRPVAARIFTPEQYLAGVIDKEGLFMSGTEAQLMLELSDPGSDAVGFEFHFH